MGWLDSKLWRAARFRSRGDLLALADEAGLNNASVTDAIFYPPGWLAARFIAPIDHKIGTFTTIGAAFLVLTATMPNDSTSGAEMRI